MLCDNLFMKIRVKNLIIINFLEFLEVTFSFELMELAWLTDLGFGHGRLR